MDRDDGAGRRRRRARRMAAVALLMAALAVLLSCSHLRYLSQSVGGGSKILLDREPIDEVLRRSDLDPRLRSQLELVQQIRAYADDVLLLPVGKSYGSYVETGRSYVLWNVVAAPWDSVQPETWCFPVAGCVSYRGYFSEEGAHRFADRLQERGLDVAVSGVAAYSTLGWFADPVLDTFVHLPEVDLAGLIFHELAHRLVYVPGDTAFNESFASWVGRYGERRYLDSVGREEEIERGEALRRRQDRFVELVLRTRRCLELLYQSGAPRRQIEQGKRRELEELHRRYRELRASWRASGVEGPLWDRWFAQELNNAHVASVGDYTVWIDAFEELHRRSGSLAETWQRVRALAELGDEERYAALEELAPARERDLGACVSPPRPPTAPAEPRPGSR